MSNKIKKLTLEYSYLSLEYSDTKLACDSVEGDIRSRMRKKYPKAHRTIFHTSGQAVDTSNNTNNKKTTNKDIRKLYRKIAAKTHPDKTSDEKISKIFSQATKAYQESDLGKLIELSHEARIENFELSEESILLLEKNIILLKNNIDTLKNTVAWTWYNSKSEQHKDKIIEDIIISKGIKLK